MQDAKKPKFLVGIGVHGCDDSSYVTMKVTQEELKVLKRLERAVEKKNTYTCTPSMEVQKLGTKKKVDDWREYYEY